MTAKVLGRVTGSVEGPRGPDGMHRLGVPKDWIDTGATIQFELPRNLACAECRGGGCDACGRAGAVTTRGRKDPPEIVTVVLSSLPEEEDPASTSSSPRLLVVRIPGRGAPSVDAPTLPRGNLLLNVREAQEPDAGVVRIEEPPEVEVAPPPPPAVEPVPRAPSLAPPASPRAPSRAIPIAIFALAVALAIYFVTR